MILSKSKRANVAKTAVAREFACFIWSMMTDRILTPGIVTARLFWISYTKPMLNPTKVTQRRLAMDSRSWRHFYIPCPCRITMQCLTSAAACAVPMRERYFWTAYSMVQI